MELVQDRCRDAAHSDDQHRHHQSGNKQPSVNLLDFSPQLVPSRLLHLINRPGPPHLNVAVFSGESIIGPRKMPSNPNHTSESNGFPARFRCGGPVHLTYLGRECPELPCDVVFVDHEWKPVWQIVKQESPPKTPPPPSANSSECWPPSAAKTPAKAMAPPAPNPSGSPSAA